MRNFWQSSMLRYYLHNYSYHNDYALKCALMESLPLARSLRLCCPARYINLATKFATTAQKSIKSLFARHTCVLSAYVCVCECVCV